MIGSYGRIAFEVSAEKILTWSGASRQGRARWARHDVAGRKPLLESTGPDLEQMELSIRLDAALGINPTSMLAQLREIRDTAEPQILTIGGDVQGKYALESLSETHKATDGRGRLILAEVSLSMTEYVEDDSGSGRGLAARGLGVSYTSIYAPEALEALSDSRVTDVLGRIPGIRSAPGMTDLSLAGIGRTLAGLPVPGDYSAGGMMSLMRSLSVGSAATTRQRAAYYALGTSPEYVGGLYSYDAPGAMRYTGQRAYGLNSRRSQMDVIGALVGPSAAPYMRVAVLALAEVL